MITGLTANKITIQPTEGIMASNQVSVVELGGVSISIPEEFKTNRDLLALDTTGNGVVDEEDAPDIKERAAVLASLIKHDRPVRHDGAQFILDLVGLLGKFAEARDAISEQMYGGKPPIPKAALEAETSLNALADKYGWATKKFESTDEVKNSIYVPFTFVDPITYGLLMTLMDEWPGIGRSFIPEACSLVRECYNSIGDGTNNIVVLGGTFPNTVNPRGSQYLNDIARFNHCHEVGKSCETSLTDPAWGYEDKKFRSTEIKIESAANYSLPKTQVIDIKKCADRPQKYYYVFKSAADKFSIDHCKDDAFPVFNHEKYYRGTLPTVDAEPYSGDSSSDTFNNNLTPTIFGVRFSWSKGTSGGWGRNTYSSDELRVSQDAPMRQDARVWLEVNYRIIDESMKRLKVSERPSVEDLQNIIAKYGNSSTLLPKGKMARAARILLDAYHTEEVLQKLLSR